MQRGISRKRALFSALFVLTALAVGAAGVFVVASPGNGGSSRPSSPRARVRPAIGGLNVPGDRVRIQGIDAGVVERIEAPAQPGGTVTLWFRIDERLRNLVREDARAQIASQGVVGGQGRRDPPRQARRARPWPNRAASASEATPELSDLIREATLLPQADRFRRRRGGAGDRRDQRHRLVDPRREGDDGPLGQGRRRLQAPARPLRQQHADPHEPRREPRGPEAHLAALALLRRPRLLRPRARPLQARLRPREPDARPRRPLRAGPVGAHPRRP